MEILISGAYYSKQEPFLSTPGKFHPISRISASFSISTRRASVPSR